jgi:hypothetical protein
MCRPGRVHDDAGMPVAVLIVDDNARFRWSGWRRAVRSWIQRLFVSERAVERHVTGIFGKLDLPATEEDHRRVLAVLAYLRDA